jgi:hypothetical protein
MNAMIRFFFDIMRGVEVVNKDNSVLLDNLVFADANEKVFQKLRRAVLCCCAAEMWSWHQGPED